MMSTKPENQAKENSEVIPIKYVAFCDVLGFSQAVENHFDQTIAVYKEFMGSIRDWPFPEKADISVYSDSILIVCSELPPLLYAVQSLWFATLTQNWLIRGGIAYGKYWEERENGSLFVVSDALVRAVRLEASVRVPAVVISPEVELSMAPWVTRFSHGPFAAPLLHFQGINFVNPFNPYWFASARMRISQLWSEFPQHEEKYRWLLALSDALEREETLVPDLVVQELLNLGIIEMRPIAEGKTGNAS